MDITHRNNIRISGKGKTPMLFAHGFGCDQNMWRFVTPAFEKDYQIILFDYVGAGKSDLSQYNEERYSDLNGYAQDVIDICNHLNLRETIFVGHSVSGMVGLIASIKKPELFSRIIQIGPSPCYINKDGYIGGFDKKDIDELMDTMDKNYLGWANAIAPAIMGNPDRPELATELNSSFCSTDPAIAKQFARVTFYSDNRFDLKNVTVDNLIMQCSNDIIAPLDVGKYLKENTPCSTLVVMKAIGHCPHLSFPEETIQIIQEYLSNGGRG